MSDQQHHIYCFTIVKISSSTVCLETSTSKDKDKHFERVRTLIPNLAGFDSKRKDTGSMDLDDGVVFYEIDSESFGHLVYTNKEYPQKSAASMLNESVAGLEKTVPEYEDAEASIIQTKYNKTILSLIAKYANPLNLSENDRMNNVGNKVAEAQDKMRDNLMTAMKNEQDLKMIQDRSSRSKLIAEEMNYETEDLRDSVSWRNRKIYIIGAIVGGLAIAIIVYMVI